ncbi:MAG: 2-succinyl-5-enolpyruvyl-6-hydroxy-3-cyclohexene-1-carboxylic-acid synthase [Nocardioides sp.]|uniref:2-succinyl-5-enolpyruvyl-6-hydroxy-3- cyclohexene-1-carboxylic-acid synthase n=1 Tax=Nocardioides sp. TaxID=35761 RepID=UPI0039E50F7E
MNASTELARAAVAALIEAGVREVVLAPGSRNAPLALAAYDAERAGALRLHVRIDERSAGFLALGLTKAGRRAAVVCTSGTAAANLHPAMLEAAHAGLRLVAVTADRPARLWGTSANQATDQVGLFTPLTPTHDVSAPGDHDLREAARTTGGPLHWNLRFDEPLLPDAPEERWVPDLGPHSAEGRPHSAEGRPHSVVIDAGPSAPRTVVVAGDDAGPQARRLAERAGWPLLAEPSSGSRTGDNALRSYRLLLADDGPLRDEIERVVVFGRPTLSRPVSRLLADPKVEVWAATTAGRWGERPFTVARAFDPADTALRPDREGSTDEDATRWLTTWREADASVSRQLDRLVATEPGLTAHEVAAVVAAALPAGGQLVVGASNPIRDLDVMHRPTGVGERRKIIANRGLSGIDGVVSTAVGAAIARAHGPTIALLGDLTFLHDANGLVIGPGEPRPEQLTLVVVNDDGGSIFASLEQGATAYADRFERLFATPHHVSIEQLCAATRTPYLRAESRVELEHALASAGGGIEVIEAVVDRAGRRVLDARIRDLRP